MSNMEVIDAVKHYQRNIERCSGNVQRMLHCLQKLYRLPVTVQHLQETGVGRTVNALRKYEGDTGEAAKALVNKWKAMVAEAESSEEEVPEETPCIRTESPPPPSSSHKHKSSHSDPHREENHSEKTKSKDRNHASSNHSDKRRDDKSSSKSRHADQGHKRRHEEDTRRDEERKRRNVVEIADKEEEEEEEEDEDDEEFICDNGHKSPEDGESDQVTAEDSDRENEENEISNTEEIDTEEVLQEDSDSSDVEHVPEVQVKHRTHSSNRKEESRGSQSDHRKSSHGSHSSRSHRDEHQKSDRSREKNHSVDHRPSKKSEGKSDSSKIESKSNSVHSSREGKSLSKEKDRQREKDKNKEKERERIRTELKKKEESRKVSKEGKREDKTKSHIPKQESKPSTSSSKSSSSKTENKSSSSKKVKASVKETEDGIDSFSGTSFADALGMMGMTDNASKKKKKVSGSGSSSSKKTDEPSLNQTGSSGSSSHKPKDTTPCKTSSQSKISSPEDINLLDPSLQLVPLDILDVEVDVDATLPAINPNYRPLPHLSFDMPSRVRAKSLTEEEALCQVMSTKNQRTKVYSGVKNVKNWAQVPSLFDMCIRILQENIDALEYTGGVPYDLLRPVLVLATPEQLFALEHYNPYLVEDTDELWESHVRRKFRSERRLDMETHREMYQRCVEESEAKLKALTKNIQNSMAKSIPVRQTKLAYVDSIAKPPRQVARKQAKFGTANVTAITPMAKVQKLTSPSSTSTNRSNSPFVPVPAPRTPQIAKVKPRMAPLMQKTMKLAKSFKR